MKLSRRQRGIVLAATLACLFLAILLSAGLGAATLSGHRRLEQEVLRQQAACLAESAAGRAAARLQLDAEYAGETWSIPASSRTST